MLEVTKDKINTFLMITNSFEGVLRLSHMLTSVLVNMLILIE